MSSNEWKDYTVHELVELKMLDKPMDGNHGSIHPKSSDYVDFGVPFIMANDLKNGRIDYSSCSFITEEQAKTLKKGFAKPGDVLLTHKATMGRTAIVDNSFPYIVLTPQVTYYRVMKGIFNKYLKYYFDSKEFQGILMNWSGSGSTRAYLGITAQRKLPIKLPTLPEQKAIANTLSCLDDKIELNNHINNVLEEIAQSIFKQWFVNFEFPDENGNPYKSSGGKMVESELGEIPEGWEISPLTSIANYQNGLAMQNFRPSGEESLPVIKIKELSQGFADNNSDRCGIDIKDSVKVYNGDILFSWSATLLVKIWAGGNSGLNQHLFKVTSDKYPKWFYYYWTKKHIVNFTNIAKDKATTMGHINRKHLEQAFVLIPKENQMKIFNEIMIPIVDDLQNIGLENGSLSHIKDTLLPKLLSGEIELPTDEEV